MTAAPTVYRFVLTASAPDDVTAMWPAVIMASVWDAPFSSEGGGSMWEALNGCERELRGSSASDFLAWMAKHCPSAIYVQRRPPDDGEDGFTFEFLIADEDQAAHYRLRWT